MLDGLDDIDWAGLGHAYGTAEDVPGLIRDLRSPSSKQRQDAIYALHGNIWHQGTVYGATAPAVPFLIEILGESAVPDRREVAMLLAMIADGGSYREAHRDIAYSAEEQASPEFQAGLEQELGWARAARQAVLDGFETYRDRMVDPEPSVRAAVAFLLGGLDELAERSVPLLRAVIPDDKNDIAKASIFIAIGRLAPKAGEIEPGLEDMLEEVRRTSMAPVLGLSAALAMLLWKGAETPADPLDSLLHALAHPEQLREQWELLPWNEGGVEDDLGRYIAASGADAAAILDRLEPELDRAGTRAAVGMAQAMLILAFGEEPEESGTLPPFADISPLRQRVLESLARSRKPWGAPRHMASMLGMYGAPESRKALQDYIAGKAPGAPFWRRWFGRG